MDRQCKRKGCNDKMLHRYITAEFCQKCANINASESQQRTAAKKREEGIKTPCTNKKVVTSSQYD